jgi:hypothetical protein
MANEHNLIPAKKGEVRNPTGRPKKVDTILKEIFLDEYNVRLSKSQTEEIIKGVLSKTRSQLMELAQNEELPFWISMIANKATKDYKKGSIHLLELLFDRVYGKPKETVDQNIEGKVINVTLNLDTKDK